MNFKGRMGFNILIMLFLTIVMKTAQMAAPASLPVNVKTIDIALPTGSPLAIGDTTGDGKDELITAAPDEDQGTVVRNLEMGSVQPIKDLTNVTSIALSDLDHDGAQEMILGIWDLQVYPEEQKTLVIYRWNGRSYVPIMSSNQVGTVCRIFPLGRRGQERALVFSKDIRGCWATLISYEKKPIFLWKKKVPGPIIYAGEQNGKPIIVCTKEKPFRQSPLPGVVLNYTFGGVYQYCEGPKVFLLGDDELKETRDLQIPYRGAIWGLDIGSFQRKGEQELVLGIEENGKPLVKIFKLNDDRAVELATLDPDFEDPTVLGFIKTPSAFLPSVQQIVTTSGACIYYNGKAFQRKTLDFPARNAILNMSSSPGGTLFFLTRVIRSSEDEEIVNAKLSAVTIRGSLKPKGPSNAAKEE